jgi:hypothetical protein
MTMGRRLTPEEKILRDKAAPKVRAVVAYGSREHGYRIGRVVEIDVDLDDDEPVITLTLTNDRDGKHRWLAYWDPFQMTIIPSLSMEA